MPIEATALSDSPSTHSLDNPPSISAEELHEILLVAHSAGNTARRRFIDALRAMQESRLYRQLGFPSLAAYADATFHYARTQVFEFLRVSKALLDLPRIARAFELGELTWSLASLSRAWRIDSTRASGSSSSGVDPLGLWKQSSAMLERSTARIRERTATGCRDYR